jgi:hypothetical protein
MSNSEESSELQVDAREILPTSSELLERVKLLPLESLKGRIIFGSSSEHITRSVAMPDPSVSKLIKEASHT